MQVISVLKLIRDGRFETSTKRWIFPLSEHDQLRVIGNDETIDYCVNYSPIGSPVDASVALQSGGSSKNRIGQYVTAFYQQEEKGRRGAFVCML